MPVHHYSVNYTEFYVKNITKMNSDSPLYFLATWQDQDPAG